MSKTALFIIGMHRSGTSALAGCLHYCGLNIGKSIMASNTDNTKGFFENEQLNLFNKSLIAHFDLDWLSIHKLPADWTNHPSIQAAESKALKLIRNEFGNSPSILIKDPMNSYLFPFWKKILNELGYEVKVILCFRNIQETMLSLQKRNALSEDFAFALTLDYWINSEKASRGFQRVSQTYNGLVEDPTSAIANLNSKLNLGINAKHFRNKFSEFIEGNRQLSAFRYSELRSSNDKDFIDALLRFDQEKLTRHYALLSYKHLLETEETKDLIKIYYDVGNGYSENQMEFLRSWVDDKLTFSPSPNNRALRQFRIKILLTDKDFEVSSIKLKLYPVIKPTITTSADRYTNGILKFQGNQHFINFHFKQKVNLENLSFNLSDYRTKAKKPSSKNKVSNYVKTVFTQLIRFPIKSLKLINRKNIQILKNAWGRENPKFILRNLSRLLSGETNNIKVDLEGCTIPSFQDFSKEELSSKKDARINEVNPIEKSLTIKPKLLFVFVYTPMFTDSSGGKRILNILNLCSKSFKVYAYFQNELDLETKQLLIRNNVVIISKKQNSILTEGYFIAIIYSKYLSYIKHSLDLRKIAYRKSIIDSEDIHWLREERSLGKWEGLNASVVRSNKSKELASYQSVDEVWLISKKEEELLNSELPNLATKVVSNVYINSSINFEKVDKEDFLFIGNFAHHPNVSSLKFIVSEIWPSIVAYHHKAKLLIAGANVSPEIAKLDALAGVQVIGYVSESELMDLYKNVKATICWLDSGAGVKGKVTEAIINKVPIITNSIGNEGIGLKHNIEAIVADRTDELIACISRLIQGDYDLQLMTRLAYDNHSTKFMSEAALTSIEASVYPIVNICIVTFNQITLLKDCIESILNNSRYPNYRIAIYSNGCNDGTLEYLKSLTDEYSHIQFLRGEINIGFVKPNNLLFELFDEGDFILLNNDTIVEANWIKGLFSTAYSQKDVGIVGPKILYPDGKLQEYGSRIYSNGSGKNIGKGDFNPNREQWNNHQYASYVSGCCMYIRSEIMNKLNGFDPIYDPCYFEDSDLCYNAWVHGYKVIVTPNVNIIHLEGMTAGRSVDTGFKKYQEKNRLVFSNKFGSQIDTVNKRVDVLNAKIDFQ